jgi:hypothetical protein
MYLLRLALSAALVSGLVLLGPGLREARAERIGTAAVLDARATASEAPAAGDAARARLAALLARDEVRGALERRGISTDEASARVAALADAEAIEVVRRLDRLPAGGSAFGTFVAVALVVLIVLIITDLMGVTDIFPWVTRAKKN